MKILSLSHRLPYAPNRGDRVRACHLLREMSAWAEVDVAALVHDAAEAAHVPDLASTARTVSIGRVHRMRNLLRAVLALPTRLSATHALLASRELEAAVDRLARDRRPDIVFSFCTRIAPLAFRPSLSGVPVVLDIVDVDSAKWDALAGVTRPPRSSIYAREARLLRRYEAGVAARARVTLCVNDRERDTLRAIAPGARIDVVQNGVDVESLRSPHPVGP